MKPAGVLVHRPDGWGDCACVVSAGLKEGSLDADARDIRLYPFTQYWFDEARIEEYNIQTGALSFVPIEVGRTIVAGRMAEGAVRIFV